MNAHLKAKFRIEKAKKANAGRYAGDFVITCHIERRAGKRGQALKGNILCYSGAATAGEKMRINGDRA
jgi:hypothetical protein